MHWEEEVPGWVYTFWKCKPVVCLSFCHFLPFRSHIISGIPLLKRKGFSNSPRSPVDHLFVTFLTVILSQLAWSGLSSCCGHCWRYSGPDCPPVVDLFLSTGLWFWNGLIPMIVMHILLLYQWHPIVSASLQMIIAFQDDKPVNNFIISLLCDAMRSMIMTHFCDYVMRLCEASM